MNYIIRKMEKKDCEEVSKVVTISWNETYQGIVKKDFLENLYLNEDKRKNDMLTNFNDLDNHQFVLEVDDKVVGFINVGSSFDVDYKNCGEIYALYIINKYKGNGYGRKLVQAGIIELKKLGYDKMIIGCLENNPTNSFYQHLGGKLVGKREFEKLNLLENIYLFEKI